ncbi:MAG: acyltransferase [Bacteroidales bacterium]|nr:acyltransferase [Bacteroidales bacterium]
MSKLRSKYDFLGFGFYFLRNKRLQLKKLICTLVVRIQAKLIGIHLGSKVIFMGIPYLRRYPLSEITIGSRCFIRSDMASSLIGVNHRSILATLRKGAVLKIGNNVGVSGTSIGAAVLIEIGNDVICGANTIITDCDWHPVDPLRRRESGDIAKQVIIEDNVWIGVNSIVLKGVRIGKNSVIGAASVVTRDIPPDTIAAGNPCKIIKRINSNEIR